MKKIEWFPVNNVAAPRDMEILLWVPDIGARPANWSQWRDNYISPVDEHMIYSDFTHWAYPVEGPNVAD